MILYDKTPALWSGLGLGSPARFLNSRKKSEISQKGVFTVKLVSFPCWASSGKCDSTDWEWDFEVSDEEYVRLKKAAEREDSFEECQEVEDI